MIRTIVPPIKSQGIKTKLVPWIKALTPDIKGRWIEPFLGTGVVAFNSGFTEAILSDTNPHVISFYKGIQKGDINGPLVRQYLEEADAQLQKAGRDGYDYFNEVKSRFNEYHDPLDFLFLSRAGFNGMMRFNSKGEWNIPFCKKPHRFSKSYVTKIVNQVNDIAFIIRPAWKFRVSRFESTIAEANSDDIIYCDPPYAGRYVDYYNGWSNDDEYLLYKSLSDTPAKFILSTWHHNDYRSNEMVNRYWAKFNIVTRDHFYHSGGKLENRRSIVEALVFNFESQLKDHNHGFKQKSDQLNLQISQQL